MILIVISLMLIIVSNSFKMMYLKLKRHVIFSDFRIRSNSMICYNSYFDRSTNTGLRDQFFQGPFGTS
jgi:hypothetical protein